MQLSVQLFAAARDLAGSSAVDLELPDGATVGDVRRALVTRVPGLKALERHLLFAVDADYAADTTTVPHGAELACFPPVSGG